MNLIDVKIKEFIKERCPDFIVNNLLIISNNTDLQKFGGFHAHKEANQILIGLNGEIDCWVESSQGLYLHNLHSNGALLLIRNGYWAFQIYHPSSSLIVLSSLEYDETDYIRNYKEWKEYINNE